ncbi:hypothetical protein MTR_7g050365 [Medicago truncatula]|uniref:Uncharacterized protein n=1 Tax=Medicago truncatula TaxID=3880 RepID=A0A072TYE7_MEDTR|nr:hypothetical protein MTR_7g050365 [Medicago truncatula]
MDGKTSAGCTGFFIGVNDMKRSGEHKVAKRKVKHETTGSRKCGCLFKMVPYVAGNLLATRLMEDDKKIVHDLTNSLVKPKNILTNLKKKRKESMTNIKQVYNEHHKFKKAKRDDLTEMQFLISKLRKIITDCKVKQNVVVVDGQKKIVDEVKHNKIVDTIFDACEKLVESPTQELYAGKNKPKWLEKSVQTALVFFLLV